MGRTIHFANLPIKLLMPTSVSNIREIALKTIPSASKIEIKRVLQSLYGFQVDKVRTLNMEGKKKKRGGLLVAKPDYKKAYVTLKTPLSLNPDLYPIRVIREDKESMSKSKSPSFVEEDGRGKTHWLHPQGTCQERVKLGKGARGGRGGGGAAAADVSTSLAKFPWSSMRSDAGANRVF
ncbi:Ribosomal_L23 domain-containing protein [Cephalotus follicularis]|uniref:Large ribosomal subunit protein uL23m n=1 Tax=Cephalotus follicularis TaxID=3775 RepID=A0A1Q3CAL5_CEPFO|nr:Ribosomal_L23 domain-containing protein [Cephalotus follicularis]